MKSRPIHIALSLLLFMGPIASLGQKQRQIDSNYIRLFVKDNYVELYPGIYSRHFNFTTPKNPKDNYKLVVNSSAYIGGYLSYKWVTLEYSWAIPGTQLAKNIRLQSTSFGFSFGKRKWNLRPFYDSYIGLLIPEKPGGREYRAFRDIKLTDAGVDIYYYFNTEKFSYRAAHSFSEHQIKSNGAFFLKITPMWQKINWENPSHDVIQDSSTYDLLSYDPEWFSFIARLGYAYNFSFHHGKWNIAPIFSLGGGALRELNTGVNHLQLVTDVHAALCAGYNSPVWYCYFNARWTRLQTNLFIKNLRQVNTNFSIVAGYRLPSLKKKILGIL